MTRLPRGPFGARSILLLLSLVALGCGSNSTPNDGSADAGSTEAQGDSAAAESESASSDDKPFVLGDLIKPFDPPATLEELEASVSGWVDSPVVDTLAMLRDQKESEPPLVSVDEALAMRNDSEEANEKILSALSAVAPEDGSPVDYEATLNRTIQMDVRSLNPILASSTSEQEISQLLAFGLWTYDWNFIPYASADSVASWQTSEDRLVDKVVLRDDLTWSDGRPITAHDVEFSFKLIMSSRVPVPAMRQGTDQIRAVKAYDDHTLVYFHPEGLPTNVWNMNFQVVPKHCYAESIAEDPTLRKSAPHAKLERDPVVGGPYKVSKKARGQEIVLTRRESYYTHEGEAVREKPFFKTIRHRILEDKNTQLLALKSGDVDEAPLGAEQWRTQTGGGDFYRTNTKVRGNQWLYFYIGWNLKSPLFEDIRVRRALALALDYEEMLSDLCFGLYPQCHGIFQPDAWMYPADPAPLYEQDLDRAEDLLDEAGWADSDGDGVRDKEIDGRTVPFVFSLLVSNKPDRIAICNLFRENLESIGIECNVSPLESAVFQERVFKKNYEAQMSGWGTGADPYLNRNIFGTGAGRNSGSYSNPEVDRLFDAGEREFDRAARGEIYGRIHNLIYKDQPYLFLYTRSAFFGFNKQLRGYRFSPRGPFNYGPGLSSVWVPSVD